LPSPGRLTVYCYLFTAHSAANRDCQLTVNGEPSTMDERTELIADGLSAEPFVRHMVNAAQP